MKREFTGLESSLYVGSIRHRRFVPVSHEFNYSLFMLSIDLDELDTLIEKFWFFSKDKINLVSFKRADYFQSTNVFNEASEISETVRSQDLKTAVSRFFEQSTYTHKDLSNEEKVSQVKMVTHLRYFNLIFNPVTFYYCYNATKRLLGIVAEITNTPWGERHAYVLPLHGHQHMRYEQKSAGKHAFVFDKAFHVSPFNPMDMQYEWLFSDLDETLNVHMNNTMLNSQGNVEKHFDASLKMERQSIANFASVLKHFPMMTAKVGVGIYYHALRLWLKKAPFYSHPKYGPQKYDETRSGGARYTDQQEAGVQLISGNASSYSLKHNQTVPQKTID